MAIYTGDSAHGLPTTYGGSHVNGVAELHSSLKDVTPKNFSDVYPDKSSLT